MPNHADPSHPTAFDAILQLERDFRLFTRTSRPSSTSDLNTAHRAGDQSSRCFPRLQATARSSLQVVEDASSLLVISLGYFKEGNNMLLKINVSSTSPGLFSYLWA